MNGIWAAVKATTSYAGSPRNTTLKSWKSRPAAPMMTTRLRLIAKLLLGSGRVAARRRRHHLGEASWDRPVPLALRRAGQVALRLGQELAPWQLLPAGHGAH